MPFDPLKDFQFLSSEEMGEYECGEEYRRFLAAFREEYVYEMMRLSEETTPFRTLGHIAGVHYIAMTVARGIREAGENVDLALVSAAAAAHDLGKFGLPARGACPAPPLLLHRPVAAGAGDARRQPHRCQQLHLGPGAGHPLHGVPVSDLLPTSAASRERDEQGRETTILYPLEESFHIILRKLENVEPGKRRRYEFVYGKLHDFEDYCALWGWT